MLSLLGLESIYILTFLYILTLGYINFFKDGCPPVIEIDEAYTLGVYIIFLMMSLLNAIAIQNLISFVSKELFSYFRAYTLISPVMIMILFISSINLMLKKITGKPHAHPVIRYFTLECIFLICLNLYRYFAESTSIHYYLLGDYFMLLQYFLFSCYLIIIIGQGLFRRVDPYF